MTKFFATSDLHFNHKNILNFEPESRPFDSMECHNEALINSWNSVVSPDDVVFVLGDFFMGPSDKETIKEILYCLNGSIYLIAGNHDSKSKLEIYKSFPDKILMIENYNIFFHHGTYFIMNHFPVEGDMSDKHLENDGWKNAVDAFEELKDNAIYLYGHVHSHAPRTMVNNTFHIGIDTNNLTPVLLDDLI